MVTATDTSGEVRRLRRGDEIFAGNTITSVLLEKTTFEITDYSYSPGRKAALETRTEEEIAVEDPGSTTVDPKAVPDILEALSDQLTPAGSTTCVPR